MKAQCLKYGVIALTLVVAAGCESMGGGASDEEMIRDTVNGAMAALVQQDVDAMMGYYSEDFQSADGMDKAGFQQFIQGAKDQAFLDGIEVDTTEMMVTVEGPEASAKPINLEGAFGALTVELDLAKRDGQWIIVYQTQY